MVFVVCLSFSGSLIGSTWYFKDKMSRKYNIDKSRFQSISNQYLAVDQEEQLVREYYPEFIELYNNGVIGEERRLNWIETLHASEENIRLPGLRFKIDSQTRYTPDYPVNAGSFQIFNSPMKLSLDLLHEGDLQRLLGDLSQHAQGSYNLSKCVLKKANKIDLDNTTKGHISAECDLKWFNIKKSDGSVIKISS